MSKIFVYDRNKYLENLNKVNKACLNVLSECECFNKQQEIDKFEDLLGNLFLNGKLVKIFLLTNEDEKTGKNIPCAYAIFTKPELQDENTWALSGVYGVKNADKIDYAKKIFKNSLKSLKKENATSVVCEISSKDEKHKKLFDNLSTTFASGFYSETESEISYVFDLTKDFKEDKTLSALGKSVVNSTNVKENLISEKIRG